MIMLVFFSLSLVSCKIVEPKVSGKTVVELKAAWDPNTETDLSHYNLYQVYQGIYQKINDVPISHPPTTYTFTLKFSDDFSEPLCFVVTAVDTSGNESDYSDMACVGE